MLVVQHTYMTDPQHACLLWCWSAVNVGMWGCGNEAHPLANPVPRPIQKGGGLGRTGEV